MSQVTSLTRADGTGLAVREGFNNLIGALFSMNSGATAPTATVPYMLWADTSTTPATIRMRNAADDAWISLGTSSPYLGLMPVGSSIEWNTTTPPAGFLEEDGSAISRTTYSELFAVIGTTFGAGDGSTTFNLPDSRGVVRRGWDNGRGLDSGRSFGSYQADAFASHTHTMQSDGAHTHQQRGWGNGSSSGSFNASTNEGTVRNVQDTESAGAHTHTINATGGSETRAKNIAKMVCIKY